MKGQKHLIKCRCVLPQFKQMPNPPDHQFVVFSVINDDDTVKPRYSQCTNCGIVHKVIEISRSEILIGKEAMTSIVTIADIRPSLPQQLVAILEGSHADLSTWEAAQFIFENEQWGNFVVLTSEVEGGVKHGKYVKLLSEKTFKVETFSREEAPK